MAHGRRRWDRNGRARNVLAHGRWNGNGSNRWVLVKRFLSRRVRTWRPAVRMWNSICTRMPWVTISWVTMSWVSRLDNDRRRRSVTRRMGYKRPIVHGMAHERSRMYRPWEWCTIRYNGLRHAPTPSIMRGWEDWNMMWAWWSRNDRKMDNGIGNNRRHDPRIIYRYNGGLRGSTSYSLRKWRNNKTTLLRLNWNLRLGHS